MNFFMANTSRHDSAFNFRLPENTKPIHQPIRIGQQVLMAKDLSTPALDVLIDQVETYGGVRVGDYDNVKGRVITYLYDVDREIPRKEIDRVMRHNTGQLVLQGKQAREEAALAVNAVMENMTPGLINELEMTVQEETAPAPGEKQIAEGIIVRDEARRQRNDSASTKKKRR